MFTSSKSQRPVYFSSNALRRFIIVSFTTLPLNKSPAFWQVEDSAIEEQNNETEKQEFRGVDEMLVKA